ncbi:hypothetical protein [Streptomyces canus]|nr:hypothetical protein [Streptomyces canus]
MALLVTCYRRARADFHRWEKKYPKPIGELPPPTTMARLRWNG